MDMKSFQIIAHAGFQMTHADSPTDIRIVSRYSNSVTRKVSSPTETIW